MVHVDTLKNGIRIVMEPMSGCRSVSFGVFVGVGSVDETPENNGMAHVIEHMMFKGTDRIGTLDYESEKVLLDSIAMKYDELAMTEDTAARARLQKEINELSIRSS